MKGDELAARSGKPYPATFRVLHLNDWALKESNLPSPPHDFSTATLQAAVRNKVLSVLRHSTVGLVPHLRDPHVGKPSDYWLVKRISNHREHDRWDVPMLCVFSV